MTRWLWLVLIACTDAPVEPAPEALPGTSVRFRPAASIDTPAAFLDVPYPFHTRLDQAGAPVLTHMPRPTELPSVNQLLSLLAEADRFSRVPTVYLRFDGPVAPAVPADGPVDPGRAFLVPLDAPGDATRVPLVAETLEVDDYVLPHTLALQPAAGFVLEADAAYGLVVRRAWGDADGAELGVPASVRAVTTGFQDPADPAGLYPQLRAALEALDVPADAVAAFSVFRTGDEVGRNRALLSAQSAAHVPVLEDLALDPDDGSDHARFCELHGTIAMPQYQRGTPPFDTDGTFGRLGADGLPEVQRTDDVPVVFAVPRGPMPADGWPVVVYAHGSSGLSTQVIDRGPIAEEGGEPTPGLGPAHVLAQRGIASVGIGALLNAERLGEARARGYLNLENVAAYRDTWRQAMLDTRLLLDLLEDVSLPADALAGCEDLDDDVVFRGDRPMLLGQSAGGHLVTELAALDDRVAAVVPSGSGGFWSKLMAEGSRVGGPPELFGFLLGTGQAVSTLHPGAMLLQTAWEGAEPMVHAPDVVARGVPLYTPFGQADGFFPEPLFDAMAVAYDLEVAGDPLWDAMGEQLALDGRGAVLDYPVVGNRDGTTAVAVQWAGDGLADPHGVFAQLDGVKHQYGCFLRTAFDGEATVVAPADEAEAPCE